MKKQLLNLLFGFITLITASAQTYNPDYIYPKEQNFLFNGAFPFNGALAETRYYNVDSIAIMIDYQDGNGFISTAYTLVKQSSDGLTDTLELHKDINYQRYNQQDNRLRLSLVRPSVDLFINTYTYDGKLKDKFFFTDIIVSGLVYGTECHYLYDYMGRISKETAYDFDLNYRGRIAEFITQYDYINNIIHYDYNYYNTLSSCLFRNSTTYIIYTDSGYITKEEEYSCSNGTVLIDTTTTIYSFDATNRLSSIKRYSPSYLQDGSYTNVTEYKYTDSGYDKYINGAKESTYTFQQDGYCSEIISYYRYRNEAPEEIISSIQTFTYFKNGQDVSNTSIETTTPKVYGIQGGIVINQEKAADIAIYGITGAQIRKEYLNEGKHTIHLPKGIYIVTIGDLSSKILVR